MTAPALDAYAAVARARFRALIQYRAAAWAGFGTQLFWGFIRVMIFEAFYRSSAAPQPMTIEEVVTYVWLSQGLLMIIPWNIDPDIRASIRSGAVAYELLRPLDLYWLWYCRALAQRTAPTLLRAAPMFLVAIPFLGMQPPASLAAALGCLPTLLGALLLSCAFTNLLALSLLWTVSGEGINRLMPSVVLTFSGLLLPLPLFPQWLQPLLDFLPFRGLLDVPLRVYMGHIPPAQTVFVFAHQLAWTLALVLFGRAILARGARRLVIQGG